MSVYTMKMHSINKNPGLKIEDSLGEKIVSTHEN